MEKIMIKYSLVVTIEIYANFKRDAFDLYVASTQQQTVSLLWTVIHLENYPRN